MSRSLFDPVTIGTPRLPNRLIRNATCISCNGCFRPGLKGEGIYCVVDRIEAENRSIEV
jgi:hypothetical protein